MLIAMNKEEFINFMASENGIKKIEAAMVIETFTNAVKEALISHDGLTLIGFGSFYVNSVPSRMGRNPKTGTPIQIKAYKQPKFKAGKKLKEICNAK